MPRFYCCKNCELTLSDAEVVESEEFNTSTFWGVKATQRVVYHVCSSCGDDVQETEAPEEIGNESLD